MKRCCTLPYQLGECRAFGSAGRRFPTLTRLCHRGHNSSSWFLLFHADSCSAMEPTEPSSASLNHLTHPFKNETGLLVLIPDGIDVEEEARLYDELEEVRSLARGLAVERLIW